MMVKHFFLIVVFKTCLIKKKFLYLFKSFERRFPMLSTKAHSDFVVFFFCKFKLIHLSNYTHTYIEL